VYTLKNEDRADSERMKSDKAENVEFTVSVQAGLEIASGTASAGAFTVGTGKWVVGDLAKGASATLTAKVKAKLDGAGKTLKITGEVSACDQKDAWAKKLWKVEKEVTVKNQCALAVSIDADEKKPKKDKEFGISAEVKNSGPHPATSVVILVQKPGAFTFLEKNASDGVYAPDGRWTIPSLAKDARATLDIRAKVAPKAKNKAQDITIAVQSCKEGDSGKGTAAWSKSVTVTPTGKCFLTTACVQGMGLPDDCHELQILRTFRDAYLLSQPFGAREIEEYYAVAPAIVDGIKRRADSYRVLERIYRELVHPCVVHIEEGCPEDALGHYRACVERLRAEYVTTSVPPKEVEA
jgi:hypothetical protein